MLRATAKVGLVHRCAVYVAVALVGCQCADERGVGVLIRAALSKYSSAYLTCQTACHMYSKRILREVSICRATLDRKLMMCGLSVDAWSLVERCQAHMRSEIALLIRGSLPCSERGLYQRISLPSLGRPHVPNGKPCVGRYHSARDCHSSSEFEKEK
jgi:hypothetical protein